MKFLEWFNTVYTGDRDNKIEFLAAQDAWDAAKQEILKTIFLNTKTNGKRTLDLNKTVAEIEEI